MRKDAYDLTTDTVDTVSSVRQRQVQIYAEEFPGSMVKTFVREFPNAEIATVPPAVANQPSCYSEVWLMKLM